MRSIRLQNAILLYLCISVLLFVGCNATSMLRKRRNGKTSPSPSKSKVRVNISKGKVSGNNKGKYEAKGMNKYGVMKGSSFSAATDHLVSPSASSPQAKGKTKGSSFYRQKGHQKKTKLMKVSKGHKELKKQQQYHKGTSNASPLISPHTSSEVTPTLSPMTKLRTMLPTSVYISSKSNKYGVNKGKFKVSKGKNQNIMKGSSTSSPTKSIHVPTLHPRPMVNTKGSISKGYQKGMQASKGRKGQKRQKGQYQDSKGSHNGRRPSKSPSAKHNPEDSSLHPSSYSLSSSPTEDSVEYHPSHFPTRKSLLPSSVGSLTPSSSPSSTPSNDSQSSLPTQNLSFVPSVDKVSPPNPIPTFPTIYPSSRPSDIASITPTNTQFTQTPSHVPFLTCKDNEMRFVLNLTPPNGINTGISWILQNCSTGQIVLRGRSNGIRACIPKDQYSFTIFNKFGGGLCCHDGFGYYEIYIDDGLVRDGGQFAFEETTIFGSSSYSSSSMRPKSPTSNPNTSQSTIQSTYPTTSTDQPIITESLIFSDLVLELSFPIKRRLGKYPYSSILDRRFLVELDQNGSLLLDEEELHGIIYSLLFKALQEAFNPYFSTLIISLTRQRDQQKVDEIKALFQLKGKVLCQFKSKNENGNMIPSQAQIDQRILKTLERQSFLQSLQMSSDPHLASIISVTIAFDNPIGKSTYPEELPPIRKNDFVYFLLVATIICCILIIISLAFCHLRINKRRIAESIVRQVLDDCSTSSPGSNQHYSNGINVIHSDSSNNHSSNAVKEYQNSISSVSQSSSPSNCQRAIGHIVENAQKGERNCLDVTKNTRNFDELWDSKHSSKRIMTLKNDTSKISASEGSLTKTSI